MGRKVKQIAFHTASTQSILFGAARGARRRDRRISRKLKPTVAEMQVSEFLPDA